MAEKVIEDIRDAAERIIEELSSEEIAFLRRYTGGSIEIEV